MNHKYDRDELFRFLDALCHGTLSVEQSQRLTGILRENPSARRDYLEYMDLHAALQWDVAGRAKIAEIGRQFCEELESLPTPRSRFAVRGLLDSVGNFAVSAFLRGTANRLRRRTRDLRVKMALALAGSLLFAGAVAGTGAILTAIFMQPWPAAEQREVAHSPASAAPTPLPSSKPSSFPSSTRSSGPPSAPLPAPVARLARCVDCVWPDKSHAPQLGEGLVAGRKLVLKSGLAEIIFANGADTILEGPAALEVQSNSSAILRRGKFAVTADTPSAHGFEVGTPGMKYSDLGTEFGLLVAPTGQQEVHVFRGRVQAEQGAQSREQAGHSLPTPSGRGAGREGSNLPSASRRGTEDERGSGFPNPTPSTRPLLLSAHDGLRVAAPDATGKRAKPVERIAANKKLFVLTEQIAEIAAQSPEFRRWKKFSDDLCERSDLVAYYDFQPDESDRTVLRNRAASGDKLDGRIEGAKWSNGPFRGKLALVFSSRNDRVRVEHSGQFRGVYDGRLDQRYGPEANLKRHRHVGRPSQWLPTGQLASPARWLRDLRPVLVEAVGPVPTGLQAGEKSCRNRPGRFRYLVSFGGRL